MKKEVVTGFINYESKLNKEVLLGAFSRFKEAYKQRQLDVQVKIYYSGVEQVHLARKVKNLMEIRLNIVELEEGLFYRVPNQETLMCFSDLPLNLVYKVEMWRVQVVKRKEPLTDAERREKQYKKMVQLRRNDFCSINYIKDVFATDEKVEVLDIKNILPDEHYDLFMEGLNGEEDFEVRYGYVGIDAKYHLGKWNIQLEIIDDIQDIEQSYFMINEEIAISDLIN